ncbi:unnamed protein product [Urochloa humidicola]
MAAVDNDVEEVQDVAAPQAQQGNGQAGRLNWTAAMSNFILQRFTELVGEGVKTDKGFKDVHLNRVAKNLSEFVGIEVTGTQVYNHLRKWRGSWVKICRLKELSGANWDEDNFMITLAPEHYAGHTKDHPKDAEFLNVPLINYVQMQTIFASGVAAGRFAMGSSEALGVPADAEIHNLEDDAPAATAPANGDPSNKAKTEGSVLGKRKNRVSEEDGNAMIGLTEAVWGFAGAVRETVHAEGAPGIVRAVMECNNFTKPQLMLCLDHLMEHKRSALGFLDMDAEEKDLWLLTHLTKIGMM